MPGVECASNGRRNRACGVAHGSDAAALDHDVVGIDEDEEKIGLLRQGLSPFYEPGLPKLIQEGMSSANLRFEVRAYDAVAEAEVVFI
jgi:UDPglucose 6-dehydrogenase